MVLKSVISPGYRWRLFAVAFVCLMFGGWSAYDGFIGYPKKNKHRDTWDSIKQQYPTEVDFVPHWEKYAQENGISTDEPEPRKSSFSMIAQYVQMGITLPFGLLFGFGYLSTAGRWVSADENGLATNRGEEVSFDSIKTLNKVRWNRKGIAVVHYDGGQGPKRLVLDDWKYDRDTTGQILREVEARIDRDLIVGGEPEPLAEGGEDAPEPSPPAAES